MANELIESHIARIKADVSQINTRVGNIETYIHHLSTSMHAGFQSLDAKIESQTNRIESRYAQKIGMLAATVAEGFRTDYARFEQMNERLDHRLTTLDNRFDGRLAAMETRFNTRLAAKDRKPDPFTTWGLMLIPILASAVTFLWADILCTLLRGGH